MKQQGQRSSLSLWCELRWIIEMIGFALAFEVPELRGGFMMFTAFLAVGPKPVQEFVEVPDIRYQSF